MIIVIGALTGDVESRNPTQSRIPSKMSGISCICFVCELVSTLNPVIWAGCSNFCVSEHSSTQKKTKQTLYFRRICVSCRCSETICLFAELTHLFISICDNVFHHFVVHKQGEAMYKYMHATSKSIAFNIFLQGHDVLTFFFYGTQKLIW